MKKELTKNGGYAYYPMDSSLGFEQARVSCLHWYRPCRNH